MKSTHQKKISRSLMEVLHNEIKQLIIDALNLEDISVDDIETDAPLFGDGLGLDSIDALELGLAIKKKYNLVLDADDTQTREHFASVANLAAYINANKA
ncbi:acyl carrier protein [Aliivibrio fischeri]|nr:acyl carrier protein [Aliivibrio sp. S10_S31]MUH95442.1 acyl carrier protein [Aliivibrio fischeri]MUI64178.1 acyl carrier protein [Aliivibrio fischeri]MUK60559.1 acyl carrier protein [Aliivibrio fischeri]MUK77529.1 acyl carrier protein [Aliivibrio fischeri]